MIVHISPHRTSGRVMVPCLFYLSIPVYLFVMPDASRTFMPFFPLACFMVRVLNTPLPIVSFCVPLLLLIFCLVVEFLFLLSAIPYYPHNNSQRQRLAINHIHLHPITTMHSPYVSGYLFWYHSRSSLPYD